MYRIVIGLLLLIQGPLAGADPLRFNSGTEQTTLIELFTSQGCSSCPPAERWLGSLKTDPRLWHEIIPVAFHVDYWDYIGWTDALARPEYSARQRTYRYKGNVKSVYTPGFLVNGREWRSWFGSKRLPNTPAQIGSLHASLEGESLTVRFDPTQPHYRPLQLNVAIVGVGLTVDVAAGENRGRTLEQDFSVLHFQRHPSETPEWSVAVPWREIQAPQRALVLWVDRANDPTVIQAVGGWLD